MLYTIFLFQLFWELLTQIVGFVDFCLTLFLVAFVATCLSIACKKCTGKNLFEVVCLAISFIRDRCCAGRVSVACQTPFGGYRSVATQTDYYNDEFLYYKPRRGRMRNLPGLPGLFKDLPLPEEGGSVFEDWRIAHRLAARVAAVQDAQPIGVTPGSVSVGSGLRKRDMSSFEEQSGDEDCDVVVRPGRKILAPRIHGAGTVKCPVAPESVALGGVVLGDNEDGTKTDMDDDEEDDLEIITDDIVSSSAPDVEDQQQSPRVEAESPRVVASESPRVVAPESPRVEADMGEGEGEEVGPAEPLVLEEDGMEFAPAGFGEAVLEEDDDMEFAPAGFGED
ncbi:hypothetical protein PV08_04343 [Exophiala spinifera]|uniref:Uncharacterized protein n=1 Tax=Exophiala spinifera TaxID=91928 RepID=A0A0D1ZWT9_9EURO|nr:uncharacterized protein PV08_04343 [Exophiala spinifera]KIW17152.1 hypothetical protein PV08_04343 [Exophiala spinifera]